MVKEKRRENSIVFACEECGFLYAERKWAEKCEEWCKKHKSCNIEITAHAISEG